MTLAESAASNRGVRCRCVAIIDVLPAHPVITIRMASAATGRTRPAIDQLTTSGVLVPLAELFKSKAWEESGLLDLIVGLEEASLF